MAFDVITPNNLGRGAIGTSVSTFHTVPTSERTIIKTIDICNNNITKEKVIVYLVPSGGSADNSTTLIPNITLEGNKPFQWAGAQVLNEGDTIQAIASTTGLTLNISGGTCT